MDKKNYERIVQICIDSLEEIADREREDFVPKKIEQYRDGINFSIGVLSVIKDEFEMYIRED